MIYGYLTKDQEKINDAIDTQFATSSSKPMLEASTTYGYLWRSPGRVTKANVITREVINLFQISRRVREELLDTCFGDRTFVLEASLYSRSVGGLDVLPPRLGMTAWVKKLLLITTLDKEQTRSKGMADLRPLQEMVNLKELRILFRAMDRIDPLKEANCAIRAAVSCVPAGTRVTIGLEDETLQAELLRELGHSLDYLFTENTNAIVGCTQLNAHKGKVFADQGMLSGSRVNHGTCRFPHCQEQDLRVSCINSRTPNALPLTGSTSSSWQTEDLNYHCGCVILQNDGGYLKHSCPQRIKDEASEQLAKLSEVPSAEQPPVAAEKWRASLQRTRRRWKSWGGQ